MAEVPYTETAREGYTAKNGHMHIDEFCTHVNQSIFLSAYTQRYTPLG